VGADTSRVPALPPPPPVPVAWTDLVPSVGPRRRPGIVTAAAALFLIFGALGLFAGLAFVAWGNGLGLDDEALHVLSALAVISAALGALQVLSGVLILLQRRLGRTLGLVLAALGVASAILTLGRGGAAGLIGLGLNGLILYALSVHREAFGRAARAG
jgi:hypothetical protein